MTTAIASLALVELSILAVALYVRFLLGEVTRRLNEVARGLSDQIEQLQADAVEIGCDLLELQEALERCPEPVAGATAAINRFGAN